MVPNTGNERIKENAEQRRKQATENKVEFKTLVKQETMVPDTLPVEDLMLLVFVPATQKKYKQPFIFILLTICTFGFYAILLLLSQHHYV